MNEDAFVQRSSTLERVGEQVVEADSNTLDPRDEGKLVHLSGKASATERLTDKQFGIAIDALRLKRIVEMYQWKEKIEHKSVKHIGGSSTDEDIYTYEKEWSEEPIKSAHFRQLQGHENTVEFPFKSEEFDAEIHVGAYKLSDELAKLVEPFEQYQLSQQNFSATDAHIRKDFKLAGNEYFQGDLKNPPIGAVRVRFEIVRPTELSVIGEIRAGTLQASIRDKRASRDLAHEKIHIRINGFGDLKKIWLLDDYLRAQIYDKAGDVQMVSKGTIDAMAMMGLAHHKNEARVWFIRATCFLVIWFGFGLVVGPVLAIADVIPFMGFLVGISAFFSTLLASLAASAVAIATAWVFYRPLIAAGCLVLAMLCCVGFFWQARAEKQPVA